MSKSHFRGQRLKLKFDWRKRVKLLYLVASVASLSAGVAIAYMGNESSNPLLILIGFGGLAGGFILFLSWRKQGDIRLIKGDKRKGLPDGNPLNCICLYPHRIELEYTENPLGQSRKNYNDGQYYHVHESDGNGGFREQILPDDDDKERYYDPGEMANVVTMPSNKKYFTWAASTMQKISIGVMAVVIAAELIGLIAIGG